MKILMLGPSLERTQGGMASVQKLILQQTSPQVQIQYISTHEEGSIAHKVSVFGRALGQLLWKLLKGDVDLVHLHVAERGSVLRKVVLMFITLMLRKPVFLHAHGCEFESFYSNLSQWNKQVVSWAFRQCTRFIVLSNSWKDFYISNLRLKAEQVVVLVNPVELPVVIPQRLGSDKVNLVFLGRLGQRKGTFDLIEAFSTLSLEQKNRSHLFLAGDGDIEQAHKLIESLNLTDYITILGWVHREQRNAILAKADIFVLPSYNEGLPMALLEAMSWGLATIITPVGGIPEIITHGQNGLLVHPGDIKQLSEAMQSLIDDESFRLSLGSSARISAEPFDIKSYSRSLIHLYRLVLEFKQNKYTFKQRSKRNRVEWEAVNISSEEAQKLQTCVREMATILYNNMPSRLATLEEIEITLHQQMLEYVSPQVVISSVLQADGTEWKRCDQVKS